MNAQHVAARADRFGHATGAQGENADGSQPADFREKSAIDSVGGRTCRVRKRSLKYAAGHVFGRHFVAGHPERQRVHAVAVLFVDRLVRIQPLVSNVRNICQLPVLRDARHDYLFSGLAQGECVARDVASGSGSLTVRYCSLCTWRAKARAAPTSRQRRPLAGWTWLSGIKMQKNNRVESR